jgi:hypothetical protein
MSSSAPIFGIEQLSLFEEQRNDASHAQKFRDPAFMKNRDLPLHRWVPWIAGYSAPFVRDIFAAYLPGKPEATVLDPFAGVGTTLVEARLAGHEAIGFELNPYPALATRLKLDAHQLDLSKLTAAMTAYQQDAAQWANRPVPQDLFPPGFRSRIPFFSPSIEAQVLHTLAFIDNLSDELVSTCFRVAFGATMVSFSNYTYEPSLGSRPGAGKDLIEEADVPGIIQAKLKDMLQDIVLLQQHLAKQPVRPHTLVEDSFFTYQQHLAPQSVDLVVTSPPYLNNYHYVRNTRPHLHWLRFISAAKEQKFLETGNFGQYWQNVRDKEDVPLHFEHAALAQTLDELRTIKPEKGVYGGRGWANYAATYFNDSHQLLVGLAWLLKPGGTAAIVVGNSILQGINLAVQQLLGELGESLGLKLVGIHCLRDKRVGSSITRSGLRNHQNNRAKLAEYVVILQKP